MSILRSTAILHVHLGPCPPSYLFPQIYTAEIRKHLSSPVQFPHNNRTINYDQNIILKQCWLVTFQHYGFLQRIVASAVITFPIGIKESARCSGPEKKTVTSRPHVKKNDGDPFTHSFVGGNRRPRRTRVKPGTWPLTRQHSLLHLKHNPVTSLIVNLLKTALTSRHRASSI